MTTPVVPASSADLWLRRGDVSPSLSASVFTTADGATAYAYRTAPADGWLRLHCLLDLAGEASGRPAPFHYVVETDVLPDHEADFNAWYDREHLPGLASVPGTVRAARYRIDGESPRYHACYDLASADVFGSPAWLAVRATDWSSRVRPAFRQTTRLMFVRR